MMKNKVILFIFLAAPLCNAWSQTDQSRINQLDEIAAGGHDVMIGKAAPGSSVKGSTYLKEQWLKGHVILSDGRVINNVEIKYDIANEIVEINDGKNTVAFRGEHVQGFQWLDVYTGKQSIFKKCGDYKLNDTELTGFFEVVVEDGVSFFSRPVIHIKDPDYVEGVDVGSRDYEIRKKEEFYLAFDHELLEIRKSNGKNIKALAKKYPQLKDFVKINKLSFNDKGDMAVITEYLNAANSL